MPGLMTVVAESIAIRLRWRMAEVLSDDEWSIMADEAFRPGYFAWAMQSALEDQAAMDLMRQMRLAR